MPSLSYTYGWSQFVRIMRPFFRPMGITFRPAGVADTFRCIWSLAAWLWAVPAALIGLALRRLDTNVQQQAVLDGVLYRITFRQLVGPIVASVAIVTVLATQEFAVYQPTGISVVATEVRMVFDTGAISSADNSIVEATSAGYKSPDQPARAAAAVATALPLVLITSLMAVFALWIVSRASAVDALSIGQWPRILNAPFWSVLAAVALLILNVGVPIWALVHSLRVPFSIPRMWEEFGVQVQGTIIVAAMAAAVAVVVAFSCASRWTPGLIVLAGAAFLIGGQLLAIALIRIYNRPWLDWAYRAFPVPVLAYVGRFGWLALAAGRGTWTRPWRELRDMAAVDGANSLQSAVSIVWPLAWPTLVAGGLLVGALSLTEVPATVLLFPLHPQVLTPLLMAWVHMARFDPMIEASLLMMLAVLLPALAAVLLFAFGLRSARRASPTAALAILYLLSSILLFLPGCSRSSQPQEIWFDTGIGPGQVIYPRGIAHSPRDDTFFVVDRMARVQHIDRNGNYLCGWYMPSRGIEGPVNLTVAPDGNVYVPDTHCQRVVEFTPNGQEIRRWGNPGTGDGQFLFPTDVAFDSKGHIFVSEYGENDRIQVFDQQAHFLYKFGKFGQGNGEISRPQKLLIDGDLVYVLDACNHRIDVFKTDGTWVRNMGSCGSGLGQFRFPYGMTMDRQGHLIVSEFGNNRIQMIDKETGKGLATWGRAGRDPGELAYPWGVMVDNRDRIVAVDAGNNRLQVFEF